MQSENEKDLEFKKRKQKSGKSRGIFYRQDYEVMFRDKTEWINEIYDETEFGEYPVVDELPSGKSSGGIQKPLVNDSYGHEHTLEEICQEMDITRERIRQIEVKALQKLKCSQKARDLRNHLYD